TSAPRANLDFIIDKLSIRPYMDAVLSSEDVTAHKPDPAIYLKSAAVLNVVPGNCVVFEDSYSGVSAARHACAKVVVVVSSHTAAAVPRCARSIHDYGGLGVDAIGQLSARNDAGFFRLFAGAARMDRLFGLRHPHRHV